MNPRFVAWRCVAASMCVVLAVVAWLLLPAGSILAAPVAPLVVTLSQPDGTEFAAVPFGDEWDNGYETLDGYTIVRDEASGAWYYAVLDGGRLAPGKLQPGHDTPKGVSPHLRQTAVYDPNRFPIFPSQQAGLAGNSGSQPTLLILASFNDRGPVGSTAADWSSRFFTAADSAQAYYKEISYNQLTLVPATESYGTANDGVIGWLNLGYNHPNTAGSTGTANQQITKDAIVAANSYIDYAAYDTNHDGYIAANELHLVIIVAGYETSYGGPDYACSPSVWGHNWTLGFPVTAPKVDGVRVGGPGGGGGYSQFGEWHCEYTYDYPGHMATMGIMVHEMGHDISWPDLYDTDGTSEGVGEWSIMGSGSWLNTTGYAGSMPAHADAFLKWYQGWLTPQQITGTQAAVPLAQAETSQRVVQVLDNPGGVDWAFNSQSGTGEYFLLENRQLAGFDAGLPGCGLLIWHIDETRTSTNSANATDSRRLVDLEEADGLNSLDATDDTSNRGDAGDPYPGSSGNTVFDYSSNPNSRLYSGATSWVRVVNMSSCASAMTADIVTLYTSTTTLTPGWNLLSVPVSPPNTAITQALSSITGTYDLVYAYSAADASNPWHVYDPAAPAGSNSLTTISESMGLWVRSTNTSTLTVTGTVPLLPDIALSAGWNLVGYPGSQARPVADALTSIAGKYDLVYLYNASDTTGPWKVYDPAAPAGSNTLTDMSPGWGYWIRATEACTWSMP